MEVLMGPVIFAYITLTLGFIAVLFGLAQFKPSRLARFLHRSFGYVTLVLVLVIYFFMVDKLFTGRHVLTDLVVWHIVLGALLFPILVTKWLVVRPHRRMTKLAPALGLTAFVLLFAAVNVGVISKYSQLERIPTAPVPAEGLASAYFVEHALIGTKCTRCHGIDIVIEAEKTPDEWEKTVKRMQAKDPDWLSDVETAEIITALVNAPPPK
jgi:hypothetical protein